MQTVTITQSEYLELLRYRDVIQSLESMLHEPQFKKDFVTRIMAAEKRVKQGKKMRFKSVEEMSRYLD
ncbi:hypothetical protein H0O00_03390 [Candidatus Micrarchaeota archaeon]|nr:hypothetical protein [Candidatus Micrarchaeota archaeon]